jgi:hypothetical protein
MEEVWEVSLLGESEEQEAELCMQNDALCIGAHSVPLRRLRTYSDELLSVSLAPVFCIGILHWCGCWSKVLIHGAGTWEYEEESEMVTLRMADGHGELNFRSDAGEQICKWLGQQSLEVLLRPTVFPVHFGDSAAELHIVDAGVKLFVRKELVRYCTFMEIRSWWNDPTNSTLSIVTLDYRTLVLGCEESAQAAACMADRGLAVAQAVHHPAQSPPPSSLSALPEGVPMRTEHAPNKEHPEENPLLQRDVHATIQEEAEEEQADGAKPKSESELDIAHVEARKL